MAAEEKEKMWMRNAATAAVLCVCVTLPGLAQDTRNEPVLPDIAPRVVEIRGQLEISLPSLKRQPLLGFNPPPRVAPIPPDRRPFVEEYKQESVDLPPSPLTPPEPPPVASLIGKAPRSGRIEASVGRYFSRTVEMETEWSMARRAAIYSNVDYRGSDGHHPENMTEDVTASFDALEALVGLQFTSDLIGAGAEVDGFLNKYRLFAAEPGALAGHLIDAPPLRDGRGGGISVWTRTQAATNVDLDLKLRYGTTLYETDALNNAPGRETDFTREEKVLAANAALDLPLVNGQSLRGDAEYTHLDLDDTPSGTSVRMFDGAGGLRISLGRAMQLSGLARLMTYTGTDSVSHTYFSPDVGLDLYPVAGLRLYVQNRPRSEHHTTASSLKDSPYLVDDFAILPTLYTLDARGGGRLMVDVFETDLHAGYQRAPNFRFFERATTGEANGYARGFVAPHYAEAAIYYVGGDVSVNLPAGLNLSAGLTYRDGSLTATDDQIPYFGPVVGRGALSYTFADGRGHVQVATSYESAREVARGNARTIGDYFDLDVKASYDFTPFLGMLVRMENLSAGYLERWEHYDQSPFVLGAGLRATW